jgi:integrase
MYLVRWYFSPPSAEASYGRGGRDIRKLRSNIFEQSTVRGLGGIKEMLNDLEKETGLHCNPHTFRRTFACLLRKAGVDTMTIKDLGRWESLEMVQRYTRSITFEDSMKHYKAPLS